MKLVLLICVLISSCLVSVSSVGTSVSVVVKGTLTCSTPFKYAIMLEEKDNFASTHNLMDTIDTLYSEQPFAYYEVSGTAADSDPGQYNVEPRIAFYHNCGAKQSCVCKEWEEISADLVETVDVNLETTKLQRCDMCDRFKNVDDVRKKRQ